LNTASSDPEYSGLSPELIAALDEALDARDKGLAYTHEEAMQMTREKYPNLF